MKKVVFFDTSYGTQNMGDYIINRAIDEEMDFLNDDSFVVKYGTHNPILRWVQTFRNNYIADYCKNADYKFVCGTNLLSSNFGHLIPNFNVNLYDAKNYAGSILIGCGRGDAQSKIGFRTKLIYRKILSKDYIHSVRDAEAKKFIESLGFKAINTGCPTMWMLDSKFCKKIPKNKSDRVIFTLTDYRRDEKKDQQLIDILKKNYNEVYFWIQGADDLEYFETFKNRSGIKLVPPHLDSYEKLLNSGNIDYVGTRLHAGVFAMRHKVRSIILIVDNRARDMKKTYNLVAIERDDIAKLDSLINSSFATDVRIDEEKIAKWKAQFK